ncbi:hypothetical protein AB0D67_10195 [Streptosporangium sp. NPDC048047]|uniref:hypothetical protein n=1 Tax=Streptosporangium sp. NPDC048047 TaxID=3155748 RepID=UPI00342FE75E
MAPRWTRPDRRVDALRGSVAVERGPLVYCAESAGDEPPLARVSARVGPVTEHVVDGVVELGVNARFSRPRDGVWPYASAPGLPDVPDAPDTPDAPDGGEPAALRLIPYHRWGNRGPVSMRVWLPET